MKALTGWIFQIFVVALLNLRTLSQRITSSLVAVVGIAGVVAVFVAVLSMAEGFRATMRTTGSPDVAIVMRSGSDSEMVSILSRDDTRIIADAPGVLRNAQGPVASAELYVVVDLPKRTTGTTANVSLRGVPDTVFAVRPKVRIVEGRMFQTGRNEIIAGRGAYRQFSGLELGSHLKWGESEWSVVGIFDAGGTLSDSELWCDAGVLAPVYRRGNTYQVVYAKLESPAAFTAFKDALTADPRVNLKVQRETDYFAEQSTTITGIITTLGTLIAGLMGIGAVFGAILTMYTAVASRTREIATLRALGFGGWPVVFSVLSESIALALIGGIIGGSLAYLAFNGFQTSTINWQTFSQVAFAFAVTPELIVRGITYALAMGLLGGVFPAVRAARLPIVTGLREL